MFKELFFISTQQMYAYIRYLVSQGTNFLNHINYYFYRYVRIRK